MDLDVRIRTQRYPTFSGDYNLIRDGKVARPLTSTKVDAILKPSPGPDLGTSVGNVGMPGIMLTAQQPVRRRSVLRAGAAGPLSV